MDKRSSQSAEQINNFNVKKYKRIHWADFQFRIAANL